MVSGAFATKPSHLVAPGEPIEIEGEPSRYVSRGGEKLEAALAHFGLDVASKRCVDCGASTGGFTDCLLQHGAATVVAVDVGRGQLHERLRRDPRVHSLERTTIRGLAAEAIGGPGQVVVVDLSFISLRTVMDDILALAEPGASLVMLVKPQFEAGRAEASRQRGVIRDPGVWRAVLEAVIGALEQRSAAIMGAMISPLQGARGNVEFLIHAVVPGGGAVPASERARLRDGLDALVEEAASRYGRRG